MRDRVGWDKLLPQVSPRIFGDDGEASIAHEDQAQEHEEVNDSSSDSEEAMADQVHCIQGSLPHSARCSL